MAKSKVDPVWEALNRQSTALGAKIAAGEAPTADEIASLGLLVRLLEIRGTAARPRRNWWPAGALASTLAVVSLRLFVRVRETDIELDLAVRN